MAKKRANGEGNIRKRKDGRWEGRYTAGHDPVTGKQIFKNVLGKTQAEVKEKLAKALVEAGQVDFTKSGQYTVGTWMDIIIPVNVFIAVCFLHFQNLSCSTFLITLPCHAIIHLTATHHLTILI